MSNPLLNCRVLLVTLFLALTCSFSTNAKPIKIIALAPHIVEMLFEIGAGDNIVGTSQHSDYPEAAKAIPRVGNYARLKIETILAMQPDVVIAWRTGNPSDDLERLQQLGIKVVYSHPVELADIGKELRLLGDITQRQNQAEYKALHFESRLKNLQQNYQNKQPISVFYELWSKPVTTVAKQAWPQKQLELCGAYNPFKTLANDYPQVNMEQVIVANPKVIIQPKSAGELNPDAINWQQYNQIMASKNKQILTPNSDILHRMSHRLVDELEQLCINIDKSRKYYQRLKL